MKHVLAACAAGAGYGRSCALLGTQFGWSLIQVATGIGAFLGLGSLTVMTVATVWGDSRAYIEPLHRALVLPVFSLVAGLSMDAVMRAAPPATTYISMRSIPSPRHFAGRFGRKVVRGVAMARNGCVHHVCSFAVVSHDV